MEEVKPRTAEYLYHTYFSLVVFKNQELVAEGTLSSCPKILELLKDKDCKFFVRRNKKGRFLAYLQGKIFIGSFLCLSFGLLFLAFLGLSITVPLKAWFMMIPFYLITGGTSAFGYYLARTSYHRLQRSLRRRRQE